MQEQYKKYIRQWQDICVKMNEAMQKDDFKACDGLLKESVDVYNHYKKCVSYPQGNRQMSFGELNYMFEESLPKLFVRNKAALKECTNLIKEDKNLLSQFKFIDSLRNYDCDGDARAYVTESLELASKDVNRKTMRESVNKLADMLAKYEIGGMEIDENAKKFYKDCEKVITEQKKINNLREYTNAVNSITNYIENKQEQVKESENAKKVMAEELEKRIPNLSEADQSLVQDIIDFKKPMVEARQEKVFNKFKNECLDMVRKLQEASNNPNDLEGLNMIKEQLENKVFNKATIVEDIAKFLEIRDVLNEK